MEIEMVFDQLTDAGISIWLDTEGKLRIDRGAPEEIKRLVREHKQAIVDVKKAVAIMNGRGIRIIRLPLGQLALAYRLGTDLEEIRWAVRMLRMAALPLVINDEGVRPLTWDQWKLRRPVSVQEIPSKTVPQMQAKLEFGRKTA